MASKWILNTPSAISTAISNFAQQTGFSNLIKSSNKNEEASRPLTAYPVLEESKDDTRPKASVSVSIKEPPQEKYGDKTEQGEPGRRRRKSTGDKIQEQELAPQSPEDKLHRNELRLHNAMQEKQRPSREEEDLNKSKTGRSSETIRRYSQVPREHRKSLRYKAILNNERPSSSNATSFFSNVMSKVPSSVSAVTIGNASISRIRVDKDKAKRFVEKSSHMARMKYRKAEEEAMHEMIGVRLIRQLVARTHFNETEVKSLQRIYAAYSNKDEEGISRQLFREIMTKQFGISGDAMLDQIYYYFDADHEGFISPTEWIMNLSTFLRGTFEEHTKFCYEMYDLKGEGAIGKSEILTLLQDCLKPVRGVDDEISDHSNIREVADMLLKKFDTEKRRYITYENFRMVVRRDPLWLQCLGQCLPDPRDVKTFMTLVADDYNSFRSNYSLPRMPNYDYERDRFNPGPKDTRVQTAFKKARTAVGIMRGLLYQREMASFQLQLAANALLRGES